MSARPTLHTRLHDWAAASSREAVVAQNVAVGVIYMLLMELVLAPQIIGGLRTTPVWPANGFAVAAAWLLGFRILPGIAVGAALVMVQQTPIGTAVVASLAPVSQAAVAVWVLRRLRFDDRLERVCDPVVLLLAAAPAGALASATVGLAAALIFGGISSPSVPGWWSMWFMRAWLGIATVSPLIFALLRAREQRLSGRRLLEGVVLVLGLITAYGVVLSAWSTRGASVGAICLPFVVWASIRFGARGAALAVGLLTSLTIAGAIVGVESISPRTTAMSQLSTFVFLLVATVIGQSLAAMAAERDDARTKRVQLEELLRHSQKMEAVGRLAGGIAHDFNNLLTAILGYTDIVVHGMRADDPRRADAEQIERAATRAAELTRQMLAFSRRETHHAGVIDLNRVLGKVEPMLRRVIGENIKLTVLPKATRALVRADAGQMEQVIMNLTVNARDAMPDGGRLTIETADTVVDEASTSENHEARPGPHVLLSVTDTGMGMSAAVRARLFEPYFTTKPAGRGTGLGLSTVYGIVRQSDGHFTVSSEVGQGSTFRVLLPLAQAEATGDPDSSVQKLPGGVEHILLIEDDPSVRRLGRDLLTRLGYTVTEAASGRAAIALGSDDTRHYDLLICDVILGDMSGPSVAEALQALRPSTRVLYVSGYTDDAIVRTGVLEQGKPFLPKPFTPVQLARRIREVLEDREAGAA